MNFSPVIVRIFLKCSMLWFHVSFIRQDQVDTEVKKLLALKAKYKEMTGEDLTGGGGKKGKVVCETVQ